MAARLVCAVGVRSVWACAAAAVLAIVNTSFGSRMGHTALSSHFLLLWALALHFESLRRGRAKICRVQRGAGAGAARQLVSLRDGVRVRARHVAGALVARPADAARRARRRARRSRVRRARDCRRVRCVSHQSDDDEEPGIRPVFLESRRPAAATRGRVRVPGRRVARRHARPVRGRVLYRPRRAAAAGAVRRVHAAQGRARTVRSYWVYVAMLVAFAVYAASNLVYVEQRRCSLPILFRSSPSISATISARRGDSSGRWRTA